jgi:hypothetical protein
MTADNIHHPEFRWQPRAIVETRRQRKTGKTIFRVCMMVRGPGDDDRSYIEYDDPVLLAQSLFEFLKLGCHVEWKGQWKPAADVVAFGR